MRAENGTLSRPSGQERSFRTADSRDNAEPLQQVGMPSALDLFDHLVRSVKHCG